MNECPIEIQLSAYLDGELPADRAAPVEAHVATCPACAEELAALRAVKGLGGSLAAPEVSNSEWDTAWSRISARIAAQPRRARAGRWRWAAAAAAAAALLAVAAGIWALHTRSTGEMATIPGNECVVVSVETAPGYSSMYTSSPDADVTIITLLPPDAPEEPPDHESGKS